LVVHRLVQWADVPEQFAQIPQVVVAPFDLLVHDHAVEALLGRLGDQFFGQRDVLLAGEAETIDNQLDFVFGVFDAFGNLHLLLAVQERHLAHLLEVHAHRVVQNVQPHLFLVFVRVRLLDAVHFGLVHDFDFEIAQSGYFIVSGWNGRLARPAGPLARRKGPGVSWRTRCLMRTVCYSKIRSASRRPTQAGRLCHPTQAVPGMKYPGSAPTTLPLPSVWGRNFRIGASKTTASVKQPASRSVKRSRIIA
jgi:hypothetical protein